MMRYNLLAFANFLAAIGGGAILSSGLESSNDSLLHKGPILALFVGTLIGLLFQALASKRWAMTIAPWFSVAAGATSLGLAGFKVYAVDKELHGAASIIIFSFLSVRFALWFFSRAMRAESVRRMKQGIPLIELGYYSGMVFGLIVQYGARYGILIALLVDAMLLTAAGLIDLANADNHEAQESPADPSEVEGLLQTGGSNETAAKVPFDSRWYWKLTIAVVCLNIGFQAVPFSITYQDKELNTYVLAFFYGGVALAALFCKTFQIKVNWDAPDRRIIGNATICSELAGLLPKPSFGLITLLAAISMVTTVSASWLGPKGGRLELPFLAAAAFIYQILMLSLLDRIGKETISTYPSEGIKLTYLILGAGTVMSLLLLSLSTNNYPICIIVTMTCSVVSFYAVRRRTIAYS